MPGKRTARVVVDLGMTVLLLLLMAYSLIGEEAHEWLGAAMLLLFVLHHIWNFTWCRNLAKGRYTPFRVVQTVVAGLLLVTMVGSMASGTVLSRYTFGFLPPHGGQALARAIHLLGFWADELAPGAPLEYGAGDGAPEDGTQARWSLDMGAPPVGNGRRPLWGRLLLPQRYRILFVDADSFCILRFWPAFGSVFRRISGHNGPFCVYRLLPG